MSVASTDRLHAFSAPTDNPKNPLSPKKLAANRANSKKSTGPLTPQGKKTVSQNARKNKHGCSQSTLLPSECDATYQIHRHEMLESLHSRTPMEYYLVSQITQIIWKLDRMPDAERHLYELNSNNDQPPCQTLANTFHQNPSNNFVHFERYQRQLRNSWLRLHTHLRQLQKDPPPTYDPSEPQTLAEAEARCLKESFAQDAHINIATQIDDFPHPEPALQTTNHKPQTNEFKPTDDPKKPTPDPESPLPEKDFTQSNPPPPLAPPQPQFAIPKSRIPLPILLLFCFFFATSITCAKLYNQLRPPNLQALSRAALLTLALSTPSFADLSADQTPFNTFRGLWFDRFDYSTAAHITTAMQRAQALGITDMIFQVRGQADAYYNSAYEHRQLPTFDPLQVAITEAHARGIKLHAWINTMPLWRGTTLPSGSDYLINQHPEYWISDSSNNHQPLNADYVTVNPTMPEVRTHLQNVVRDIASKYQIDGLHLDYTRMTVQSSTQNIIYPTDPATVARFQVDYPGQTPTSNQANYKTWVAGQITLTVAGIRDALKTTRPGAQLTAAVWRDADVGLADYQQDWNTWIDQGLLDAAMPMIYRKGFGLTQSATQDADPPNLTGSASLHDLYRLNVTEALERRGNSGIMPGLATYMQNDPATAYNNVMAQLNYAKAQGANGIQLYDYGTLYYNGTDTALRDGQAEARRALTDFFAANSATPPQTSITNFEADEGYFATNITVSGSNQNVAATSTADRVTTDSHGGTSSQRLVINKTAGAATFLARHLSGIGTAGDFASNLQFASIGSVGFWLKTSTPDLQVSFSADDAASASTERGFFKNVIPDGQWHKYEWFLDDVGQWDSFSGGNGHLANIFATDSIQFTGTAATNTIFLDDVFYDAAAIAPNQWTLDTNGNWSAAGNWTGPVPNGLGASANLLRRATTARTLTLTSPVTLGSLTIDNSFSYTIAGASQLTMDVASGSASITVLNRGNHFISAPFVLADPTNVSVDVGSTLTFSAGFSTSGKTLTKLGAGELIVNGAQVHTTGSTITVNEGKLTLNTNAGVTAQQRLILNVNNSATLTLGATQNLIALNLANSAKATLASGANKILKTNTLTLSPTATLDLTDNDAIVQASAGTRNQVLADVTSWIASARNSLATRWTGPGLTSSTAAADSRRITTLAVILNDNGAGVPLYTTFDGQTADINSILVKFTYTGDTDLDGDIDPDDFARLDNGFANGLTGYAHGDFDFNGIIDSDDFFQIDKAFSMQGTPLSAYSTQLSAVPDPSTLVLLASTSLLLTRRRCRYSPACAPRSS